MAYRHKGFIKPSHRGRFTAWEKAHGYKPGSESGIRAGEHSKSTHVRSMAHFADNAKHKFHHKGKR